MGAYNEYSLHRRLLYGKPLKTKNVTTLKKILKLSDIFSIKVRGYIYFRETLGLYKDEGAVSFDVKYSLDEFLFMVEQERIASEI